MLGPIVLLTKVMLVAFLMFWVRFTYPRLREDQLQAVAWKFLIPIGLANILITGAVQGGVLMPKLPKKPKAPGLIGGLGVTFKTMLKPAVTVQYPHEQEDPPPRARGVIALKEENCTVCMLCARQCPDWCIYIEGHKEKRPPRREGGRERTVSLLDRFDIDYALCMYCGICVEVCPFDALFWSPEYEYSESNIADLLHDKEKLGEWMETVPRTGAARSRRRDRQEVASRTPAVTAAERRLLGARDRDGRRRRSASSGRGTSCTRRCSSSSCSSARRRSTSCSLAEFVASIAVPHLHRRDHGAVPLRHHADARADERRQTSTTTSGGRRAIVAVFLFGVLIALLVDAFGHDNIKLSDELAASEPDRPGRRLDLPELRRALRGRLDAAARRAGRRRRPRPEGLTMGLNQFLILTAFLFCTGVYGVLARRNGVLVLMRVELMLNAVNINLVAFAAFTQARRRGRSSLCSSSRSPPPRSASASRSSC